MQITVLLSFALVLALGSAREPFLMRASWGVLSAAVGAYWLATAGLSAASAALGVARLRRAAADEAPETTLTRAGRLHHRLQLLGQAWLVLGLTALMGLGLISRFARLSPLGPADLPQALPTMGVLLVALILYWLGAYRFDRAMRVQVEQELMLAGRPVRPGWSRGQYLDFHIRHHFLFVAVPIGLVMLCRDAAALLAPRLLPQASPSTLEWVQAAAQAAAIGGVFLISPMLLVRVWRTRPMGDGELRRRIERLCDRVGMRYRQLRVWDTAGVIANAGVMGLHRRLRYVLVTDALLENMSDAQIVAVFGHEAGHIKHHHLGYFVIFALAAMTVSLAGVAAGNALLQRLGVPAGEAVELMLSAAMLSLLWGVGFGWLSRRFERQADVYGAWCAGLDAAEQGRAPQEPNGLVAGAGTFMTALENVALLNGMSRTTRNWRHGSIASRVAFLAGWASAGRTRQAFDRTVVHLKAALWVALLVGLAAVAVVYRVWPA